MKTKNLSLIIVVTLAVLMFAACSFEKNYGQKLPPSMPASIPIIEGNIEESRTATFDDGKGFVIGIRTPLSYKESIKFYKDAFETSGDPAKFTEATNMSGTSQR